jgi:hypothetical protein
VVDATAGGNPCTTSTLAVSKPLTPEDVERLTAVFYKFDEDGGGTLDPDELNKVLEDIEGEVPEQTEINLAVMEIDKDFDGTLDLKEFLDFMCIRQHHLANHVQLDIDLCKKQANDAYAKAWKNVLLIMFMVVPPCATKVCSFMICDTVEGVHVLRADIRRVCFDGTWWWYSPFFFSGFIVYIIGFPAFFWVMLYKNKKFISENPGDTSSMTFRKLGFLYMAYTPSCWWWDVFETYRRLFLGISVSMVGEGTYLQILYAIILTEMAVITHSQCNPFKAKDDNTLQFWAYTAYLITLMYGFLLKNAESANDAAQPEVAYGIASVNWLVVLIFIWQMLLILRKLRKLLPKMLKAMKSSVRAIFAKDEEALMIQKRAAELRQRRKSSKSLLVAVDVNKAANAFKKVIKK